MALFKGSGLYKSIFRKVLSEIEKIVKTFSIFNKFFSKLIYYCVSLEHPLIIKILIENMDSNIALANRQ